jgi:peptide/nickel transport system permease protein
VIAEVGWAATIGPSRALGRPWTLVAGCGLLAAFLLVALAAPLIAPFDPIAQDLTARLKPPSSRHLFGTDFFGRDVLSRVIWGTRVDLQMAVFGVTFPFLAGTLVGTATGYLGGIVDTLCMRLVDVVVAFPFLVLMLGLLTVLGPGIGSFYIAMALVGWVAYARLARAQILVLKSADYAVAAVSLGLGRSRIMFRHLLPHALVAPVVYATSDAALALMAGASVGYLGLGVQPPVAEWGAIVAEGQSFISTAWWITLGPGLAIVALALTFSLLGDGLADHLGRDT